MGLSSLPELDEEHKAFLKVIGERQSCKLNGGEAYGKEGNPLWPLLEQYGLIKSVGSYKWVLTLAGEVQLISYHELAEGAKALNGLVTRRFIKLKPAFAVFAYSRHYPDGGAEDFIGVAENGTAQDIINVLRATELDRVSDADAFSVLDVTTRNRYSAGLEASNLPNLEIYFEQGSSTDFGNTKRFPQELIEEFRKIKGVTVHGSNSDTSSDS
jgi:hypothetical protein